MTPIPTTPAECLAERERVLRRMEGMTRPPWRVDEAGNVYGAPEKVQGERVRQLIAVEVFSEADERIVGASPDVHQSYADLLAAHADALARLAQAEALAEDAENGYQRLWNALWDVRERLERGWNCTPSQLIDFMQAAQEVELDHANWPAQALATAHATAQEVQE